MSKPTESKVESLGDLAVTGLSWQVVANFLRFGAQFGITVVLARLLPPEDFGVIGIAYLIIGFVQVVSDLGFGQAIIQRDELTERHIRVCHTISVSFALLLVVALFFTAPMVASFFNDLRVSPAIQALTLSTLFVGFGITAASMLARNMAFKAIIIIELISAVLGYGVVSIAMAYTGFGYWSLIAGAIVQSFLASTLSYIAIRHPLKPLLAQAEFRDLVGFSTGSSLTSISAYFALKGDYFFVGRNMSAHALGLYARAYTLMELPLIFFGAALSKVLFPVASRIRQDKSRFKRGYLTAMLVSVSLSLPVSLALVILAPEIILVLFGEVWKPSIPLLQILCLFGVFRMSYNTAAAFLRAKGHVYYLFACIVIYGVAVCVGAWYFSTRQNLAGVAWAIGCSLLIMWTFVTFVANRKFEVRVGEFLVTLYHAATPGLVIATFLAVFIHGLRTIGWHPAVILVLGLTVFSSMFAYGVWRQFKRLDHPAMNSLLERITKHFGTRWLTTSTLDQ
jgi:PST family polysaccharide transporter